MYYKRIHIKVYGAEMVKELEQILADHDDTTRGITIFNTRAQNGVIWAMEAKGLVVENSDLISFLILKYNIKINEETLWY